MRLAHAPMCIYIYRFVDYWMKKTGGTFVAIERKEETSKTTAEKW
jgi:hypothetical protein